MGKGKSKKKKGLEKVVITLEHFEALQTWATLGMDVFDSIPGHLFTDKKQQKKVNAAADLLAAWPDAQKLEDVLVESVPAT